MADLRAPEQNRLLGRLADMLRMTEGQAAAPEFLPPQLNVMNLVRQLMLPSAETVEKMSYGDPLFRMPQQSRIPITTDKQYLADIAGMVPFTAPAARPSARAMQDLVREIQTTIPVGAISPEIAARVIPQTKVVDKAGNPKLVYHGTNKDFEQFSESMLGSKTGNPTSKMGYFFSDSPSEASRYTVDWGKEGGNVRPVYLDIKNPKRLTYKEMNDISMALFDKSSSLPVNAWKTKEGRVALEASAIAGRERANKMAVDLREKLISEGYDGAVVRIGGKDEYIAFNPSQIRSATSDPQMVGLLDQPAQNVTPSKLFDEIQVFIEPKRIEPPHGVEDKQKLSNLVNSMSKEGWKGRPILAYDVGRGIEALTGSHRIAAARKAGLDEIPVVMVDERIGNYVDDAGDSIIEVSRRDSDEIADYLREFGDENAADLMSIESRLERKNR